MDRNDKIEKQQLTMELRVTVNSLAKMSLLPQQAEKDRLKALKLIDKIEEIEDENPLTIHHSRCTQIPGRSQSTL
jgi:hypothetical protein